ncbi:hypothetical protein F0562_000596 [Nyssa sinensis]|uniref:Uncharacterized protein n=1 Tax=Nyssa sinensis TaxID=561372 RepID=A0A5J5C4U6_9ASTE|nr:hypothetical protein F0562_000596 [Nyssa sinensis]
MLKITASSRRLRIQNIFTLCGNYRELSQHTTIPIPAKKRFEDFDPDSSPVRTIGEDSTVQKSFNEISQLHESVAADPLASNKLENKQKLTQPQIHNIRDSDERVLESKENFNPEKEITGDQVEVYVKWEASKENPGKFISILNVAKDSTLADLRKLIEIHLGADKQAFTFLVFGDPTGAPVPREKEATLQASKLPICNNQLGSHLACLRPVKGSQCPNHIPFSPLENKLPGTPNSHLMQQGDGFSPKIAQHLSSTPFITVRRY